VVQDFVSGLTCCVNKPHHNSSLSWLIVILVHTTGSTWYKILYHHTMCVMGIYMYLGVQFYWWWKPSHWQTYHIMFYRVHLTMCGIKTQTFVVIGTNCTGSCKSNYHIFTTTTVPSHSNVLECHLILMSTLFTLFQLVLTVMLTTLFTLFQLVLTVMLTTLFTLFQLVLTVMLTTLLLYFSLYWLLCW
jgi:hypothetical protein